MRVVNLNNFKLKIYKFLFIQYCPKCLKTNIDWGYWSRARDFVYGGCHGDSGHRCFDCGYITWKTPIEEYRTFYDPKQWIVFEDSPRFVDGKQITVDES